MLGVVIYILMTVFMAACTYTWAPAVWEIMYYGIQDGDRESGEEKEPIEGDAGGIRSCRLAP
jgi:hypothetical protein